MKTFKKILLVVMIALVGFSSAEAKFRFGIKAGLNVDNLSTDISDIYKDKCGWTAGVMSEFQVPLIGLCFDLSLMYTYMDNMVVNQNDPLQKVYNKNFLEIPLNIKYKISLPAVGNIISPYVFTGPAFAFKLDKNTLEDFKTKTCQVAWNIGVGLELIRHLQVGASYGFGLNNIADFTGLVNAEKFKVKNNYWTITAAYLF